jgi:hypothetical protein
VEAGFSPPKRVRARFVQTRSVQVRPGGPADSSPGRAERARDPKSASWEPRKGRRARSSFAPRGALFSASPTGDSQKRFAPGYALPRLRRLSSKPGNTIGIANVSCCIMAKQMANMSSRWLIWTSLGRRLPLVIPNWHNSDSQAAPTRAEPFRRRLRGPALDARAPATRAPARRARQRARRASAARCSRRFGR